jgi:hypothetical protein
MSKKIIRIIIVALLILSLAGTAYFCYLAYLKSEWGTITGGMAVVAALITVGSSINLTWRMEDEKEPYLNIFFDSKSHKHTTCLVIRNDGGSPAFNIRLKWEITLLDMTGRSVQFNDDPLGYDMLILNPGSHVSRFIDSTQAMFEGYKGNTAPIYNGVIMYSTSPSKKSRRKQEFRISMEQIKRSLMASDDQAEFYFNNNRLTEKVNELIKSMNCINENLKNLQKDSGSK